MFHKIAGIDVHKAVLMVVITTAGEEVADPLGEALEFKCRKFGTGASDRQELVRWLKEHNVHEVVMESTAQYWKPVWFELEPHFEKLHPGTSAFQSGAERPEGRFSRCQAADEAVIVR